MEKVTHYKANDGTIFTDKKSCTIYEQQLIPINHIISFIGKKPVDKGCLFANGSGYIQHDPIKVEEAKVKLKDLAKLILKVSDDVNTYFIGRYINDSGNKALNSAWYRLNCCDIQGREWGQSYFAYNPDKGKQILFTE